MSHTSKDVQLLVVRHLIAGHGVRGASRATGANQRTVMRINSMIVGGKLADMVAEARRHAPPSAIDAMPDGRKRRLGGVDSCNRSVEPVHPQVKPHPLKPDPNRRRGRPLRTESGRTISHEELLTKLVAKASELFGWRGMGEGAGI